MDATPRAFEVPPAAKYVFAGLIVLYFCYEIGPLSALLDLGYTPRSGQVTGGDYPIFWLVAREVLNGRAALLYDPAALKALAIAAFGPEFGSSTWLYPPHALLILAPPAMLPFGLGWLVLLGGSLAIFLITARAAFPPTRNLIFALLLCPAVIGTLLAGQTGLLASAFLLGGILLLDRRPIVAGLLIGLLTIKPQLGLLIPFVLIASGAWLTFAIAAATAASLMVLSAMIFGFDVWPAYLAAILQGEQAALLEYAVHKAGATLTSLYGLARIAGLTTSQAFALQGVIALLAFIAAIAVARSRADPVAKGIAIVALGYCVSSYLMIYDFPALGAVAAAMALGAAGPLTRIERGVAWTAYAVPLIQFATGWTIVPLGSLVVIAFAAMAVRRVYAAKALMRFMSATNSL